MSESEMRRFNPWWLNPATINEDDKITAWKESKTQFVPKLKGEIEYDFEPDNSVIYTLRGPRSVGKTTMVKLQIRDLLERGTSPWNILYYSLDAKSSKSDILDIIEAHANMIPAEDRDGRRYIFLDEITSITDWEKGIKHLKEAHMLQNCTVMATGSQITNIRRAVESLPDRRGEVKDYLDKVLLPMKFSEYASVRSEAIREVVGGISDTDRTSIFSKLLNQEIDPKINEMHAHQNELDYMLSEYMITGGIPKVVDEKISTGKISESTYANQLDGIRGEWGRALKNESMLGGFCRALIRNQANLTSWNGIAGDAGLGNSKTAADYADVLVNIFVVSTTYMYDRRQMGPNLRKGAKIYFQDPMFLHVFNSWNSPENSFETSLKYVEDAESAGTMAEGIVAGHLARWAFAQSRKKRMFNPLNHVLYWKDKNGREVDFVLRHGGIEVPIEVKFRESVRHRELGGMANFIDESGCPGGIVISKRGMEIMREYVVIPASIFLLLI